MHKHYTNAIVTGSVAFDDIMDFPSEFIKFFHPEKLHQINVSFVVDRLDKQLGGTGTNIAYNLSMITKHGVKLLAGVGKDAKDFLAFLDNQHIDRAGVLMDETQYTATGKVITDQKGNQIWGFYYGACERGKDIDMKPYLNGKDLVIISANHPKAFLNFQTQCIQSGIDYLYDPGMAMTWIKDDELRNGIEHCTFLIGNDYEIAQISRTLSLSVEQILAKGKTVITTLGENGVKYQNGNTEQFVSACKIDKVVDPTGAGDAWRGGFVGALMNGLELVDCLRMGNAMASFAVEKYGTVNHAPTEKDIKERMKHI
ncbi:MAG: hypothetical protein RI947_122 [Candidatus Parcubacteria bacterium]|jgi:adenosine kinase